MGEKQARKGLSVLQLTLGALYVAMFALAGNVPVLSAIQIIPGVPITLQVFLIAMMGLTLGCLLYTSSGGEICAGGQ